MSFHGMNCDDHFRECPMHEDYADPVCTCEAGEPCYCSAPPWAHREVCICDELDINKFTDALLDKYGY